MKFETKVIHAGQEPDPRTGAVMTPIYATSTYAQSSPGEHKGYDYARTRNPTRDALEACVAELEGGKHGFAFASGMAAIGTVLELLDSGAHVVAMDDLYGGSYRILESNNVYFSRHLASRFPKIDVAAAYQRVLEIVAANLVRHWVEKTGATDVVLAGGVASNVKMNQRIYEVEGVERIFVYPNMGDGGCGTGLALLLLWPGGVNSAMPVPERPIPSSIQRCSGVNSWSVTTRNPSLVV